MAEIHGVFYIIGGIFVSIASFMLNENKVKGSFTIFFFLGIILTIVGLVKAIKAGKHSKQHTPVQHKGMQHRGMNYCQNCGTMLNNIQQACHRCGMKLFKR